MLIIVWWIAFTVTAVWALCRSKTMLKPRYSDLLKSTVLESVYSTRNDRMVGCVTNPIKNFVANVACIGAKRKCCNISYRTITEAVPKS